MTAAASGKEEKKGPTPPAPEKRGYGRTLRGVVTSNKMAKTITVEVVRTVRHAKYNKFLKHRSKYYAHDEKSAAGVGDQVIIVETRPMSKLKRWRLQEISQKASV